MTHNYKKLIQNQGINLDKDSFLVSDLDSGEIFHISSKAEAIIGHKYNDRESWNLKDLFFVPLKSYIDKPKSNLGQLNLLKTITSCNKFVQVSEEVLLIGEKRLSILKLRVPIESLLTDESELFIKKEFSKIIIMTNDISSKTALYTGDKYLKHLTRAICSLFNMRWVGIGFISGKKSKNISISCIWNEETFDSGIVYPLKGSPCLEVLNLGRAKFYLTDVCKKFPDDKLLQEMKINAYIGVPLINSEMNQIGILWALSDKAIKKVCAEGYTNVLNILSVRAGIELDALIDKGFSKKRTLQPNIFKPLSGKQKLTKQEKLVSMSLLKGLADKEIAISLEVSIDTVKFHLKNIYKKTGFWGRNDIIRKLNELNQ